MNAELLSGPFAAPSPDGDAAPILVAEGIAKSYGGVRALTDARLEVRRGEVHALLGENGAGKSTLVKIIAGAVERDAGTITWAGAAVELGSLKAALDLGIRVIHQRLNVIDHLTVGENLTLGRERNSLGWIDRDDGRRRARASLERLGVDLDLDRRASGLRVAERQLIEIARAIAGDIGLLIMDEPTASLGEREVERLFGVISSLRAEGVAIVFISHKLDEVLAVADRVTVLRDGAWRGTVKAAGTTAGDLVDLMVGRHLGQEIERESHVTSDVLLSVRSLSTDTGLVNVTFDLHRGEVLGVYGLMGSGRTELARALFGADLVRSGRILIEDQELDLRSPADAKRHGIGMVPEDRAEAVFPFLSVGVNLTVASADLVSRRGWFVPKLEALMAATQVRNLAIRTPSVEEPVGRLSGGNQQKALVGRWLMRDVRILIMDDPTAGIDVGTKQELYRLIQGMTARGTSVIMSSSELPELIALSDRMLVLHRGAIAGILAGDDLNQHEVLHLAVRGRSIDGG